MNADFERIALGANPDAVVITAATGEVLHWSAGAESTFGFCAAEAAGQSLRRLVVPEGGHEQFTRHIASALREGSVVFESLCRRKDGALIHVDGSCRAVGTDGQVDYLLFAQKDVTQLRVRRDAQALGSGYAELIESLPDAIVIVNAAGRIVFANAPLAKMFGYAHGELRGKAVSELLPERLRDEHARQLMKYFSQPHQRALGAGVQLHGMRRNGSEFPVEISLSPLHTGEGTLAVSAIRDSSERKRIELVLANKNLELQAASEAKNRFLSTMSHELRTPLNAIIGFTGTLLMHLPGPLNSAQDKQLNTIKTSAHHLLGLINDVLDVTKIESGKFSLAFELLSCPSVVADAVAALRPQAHEKGLELHLRTPAEDIVLNSDRRVLTEIVGKLLANAIKFTDRGSVTVSLERKRDSNGPVVCVCVRDTGCGIKDEDLGKLFRPFEQVDSSLARKYEGTGLGLYLAQKLAASLGARITCVSEFGKGSTFELALALP